MIIGKNAPGSQQQRLAAREAHVKRLDALQDAGRLVLAGPCPAIDSPDPGPAASAAAGSWLNSTLHAASEGETHTRRRVYHQVTVKPFRKAFPR